MRRPLPDWVQRGRDRWQHTGRERPAFADVPTGAQESVWDYPRPPRIAPDPRRILVQCEDRVIAESQRALRVLETSSPPTFYLPPSDIDASCLHPAASRSLCEWKGEASHWHVVCGGRRVEDAAWSYPAPFPEFQAIAGHVAFYPAKLACFIGDERVRPQPGRVYGGWISDELVGPFKGEAGSEDW